MHEHETEVFELTAWMCGEYELIGEAIARGKEYGLLAADGHFTAREVAEAYVNHWFTVEENTKPELCVEDIKSFIVNGES